MILNIILLGLVFGSARKKYNPYMAALILGLIKGGLYFIGSRSWLVAVLAVVFYSGIAAAMVYFLSRIDRKELKEDPYPKFGLKKKSVFKWEYVPLSVIVGFLIFGETVLNVVFSQKQEQANERTIYRNAP
jgi:hypothetical protein